MRRNKKSEVLAILLAMSLTAGSAVYVQAAEVSATPAAETDDPEDEAEARVEEHVMKEFQTVEPTCTEAGYVLWKCTSCEYEEKRDLKPALGHELEVFSTEEATESVEGKVVYKCKRENCDYTETNVIPVKEPGKDDKGNNESGEDGNTGDQPEEDGKSDDSGESKPDHNESGKDSEKPEESQNDESKADEEELPNEDTDEEYAAYASSTSTEIVSEYDPTTASHTIKVAKDAAHPGEVEEIEGKTVSDNTARVSRDEAGNITDLAISTEVEKIKNGFSLTSETKTLKSISIINEKDMSANWFTLNAGKPCSELGMHMEYFKDKTVLTLTENKKTLNIVKVTEDETCITLKTSTGGSFVIRKNLQKFSTDLEGPVNGTKNRIVLNGTEGSKPSLELSFVREKNEDNGKDNKTENKENSDDTEKTDADRNEEHYWIRAYNDAPEPIIITVYKR